jgi:hypothetical protein
MSHIERLEAAGIHLAALSEEQRRVLAGLSAEELDVLVDVKRRLDDADGDVEGHQFGESGGAYW